MFIPILSKNVIFDFNWRYFTGNFTIAAQLSQLSYFFFQDHDRYSRIKNELNQWKIQGSGGGGGGEGGSNKAWDRETMFSQLAKRSARHRF